MGHSTAGLCPHEAGNLSLFVFSYFVILRGKSGAAPYPEPHPVLPDDRRFLLLQLPYSRSFACSHATDGLLPAVARLDVTLHLQVA